MDDKEEVKLLDITFTIIKHRMLLLKIVIIITLISLAISLIWPKTYKSTVVFFPPPVESMGFSGLLGNLVQSSPTTQKLSSEAILVILNSRKMKEEIAALAPVDRAIEYWKTDKERRGEILDRMNPEMREIVEGLTQLSSAHAGAG